MACRGLMSFLGRERPIQSMQWLPVFALTVILANQPTSAVFDFCPNGTYPYIDTSQNASPSSVTGLDVGTTSSWTQTTTVPECRNCSDNITHCITCELVNSSVHCLECKPGYSGEICTQMPTPAPTSDTTKIIVGVVVGVGATLIVAGVIVGIVFALRRKDALPTCKCCKNRGRESPPPLPPPDELGASFTKKEDNQSGTGQRVDLRYTGEPGATQPRVESVHYDRYKGPQDDCFLYMNTSGLNIPAAVQEDNESTNTNTDDQNNDQLYVNAGNNTSVSRGRASKPKMTQGQESSKGGPPQTKPKPQTSQKPTSTTNIKTENRGSLFPPTESEDIYTNEVDPEDDEEDYVNSDSYQQKKP